MLRQRVLSPLFLLTMLLIHPSCMKPKEKKVSQKAEAILHKSHLSNAWYPNNAQELSQHIDDYFEKAQKHFYVESDPKMIKALIVPHAGHYFSGLCAATAYQTLFETKNLRSIELKNKKIDRVIVLCPTHTTFFKGVALPHYDAYQTALGTINIDEEAVKVLSENSIFKELPEAHNKEHAIEIQLPFLQKTICNFSLIPLIVGHINNQDIQSIGDSLKKVIDDNTLIIISSDFIHYGKFYEYAIFENHIMNKIKFTDSLAIDAISTMKLNPFEKNLKETGATICGQNPIKILLQLAEQKCLGDVEQRLTCYYTSQHMAKTRKKWNDFDPYLLIGNIPDKDVDSCVSYAGMALTTQKLNTLKKENQLTSYEKKLC